MTQKKKKRWLTQEKFGSKFVYAERQPQWRRDASETNDQGVHVYARVDGLFTVEGIAVVSIHHDDAGHVAHGRWSVREAGFELFVAVKQLGEPDHKSVITEIYNKH